MGMPLNNCAPETLTWTTVRELGIIFKKKMIKTVKERIKIIKVKKGNWEGPGEK